MAAERDRLGGPMLGQPPRLGPGRRESVHSNNATGETHLECRLDDGLAGLDGLADGVCNPRLCANNRAIRPPPLIDQQHVRIPAARLTGGPPAFSHADTVAG